MQGDLYDRPERNTRSKPFDDNDGDSGSFNTGITINPIQNSPDNHSISDGNSGYKNSPMDSKFDSLNDSGKIDSKTNNDRDFFGRFFRFGEC